MSTKSIGSSSVSTILNGFTAAVNTVIQEEIKNTKDTTVNHHIEAARDVGIAIGNAHTAYDYQGALSTTVNEVDQKTRDQIFELKGIVETLQARQNFTVLDLQGRIQKYIKSLPLADWQPQLTGVSPRYVIVEKNRFTISFLGLFRHVAKHNGGYLLSLGIPAICTHIKAEEGCLSFEVTLQEALPPAALTNRYFMLGTLAVDYNTGVLRNIYKRVLYEVWIGTWSLNIGRITITRPVTHILTPLRSPFRSVTLKLSRKDFASNTVIEKEVIIPPSEDWQINMDAPIELHSKGSTLPVPRSEYDSKGVKVKLRLGAYEEEVETYVTFEETKPQIKVVETTTEIPSLKWGEKSFLNYKKFQLQFKSVDGKDFECSGADESNPYLKVIQVLGGFELVATAPLLS